MARPPRLARWIAAAALAADLREFVLGDLEERFSAIAATHSLTAARRWYRSQAWGLVRHASGLRSSRRTARAGGSVSRRIDMSTLWRDTRMALRAIRIAPGYSAITILTLALAIGANTLLFSIANPLVVRALPIADPDRLGWILLSSAERDIERGRASLPEFLDWRAATTSFTSMGAMAYAGGTLTGHGDARRVQTARVTTTLPEIWGLQPIEGRLFGPGEDRVGAPLVAVLSYRFWREAFDADRSVVGRTFALDGQSITVIGIMTRTIELGNLGLIDLWVPLPLDAAAPRDRRTLTVVGRLAPSATLESADAELQTLFANQTREHPEDTRGWRANVVATSDALSGSDTWLILGILAIVVLFVLLIACANLANLVLARLVGRRQEAVVRMALGASRWQLVRPLLVESAVLSFIGGLIGLAVASGGLRIINAVASEPFMRQLGIDGNVLVFTAALSIVTPLLFGLWPALGAGRAAATETLHGVRTSGTRGAGRRRNLLIGAQVALALSLLVVSALMTQSMMYLRSIDPGFEFRPLLTYRFDLPDTRYRDAGSRAAFARALQARLASLPGVAGAAVLSHMPVIEGDAARVLTGTLHDGASEQDRPWASWFCVSPGFFETAGIPLVAGRRLEPRDRDNGEPVAVLNRLAADRYFDGAANAIGRRVVIHDAERGQRPVTIVGVVDDTRDAQLTRSSPQVYVPLDQWPAASLRAIVRSPDPLRPARDVQAAMRDLDPEIAVADLKPMAQVFDEELSSSRIINGLLVAYAVLALVLAAGGLFGVISYAVGQRRREFGVRLALGASPRAIARMILREGLVVTGLGAGAGLLIAVVLARMSASILFGISPRDPATFAGVSAVILLVALGATWIPAARAMRVDPAGTLRAE